MAANGRCRRRRRTASGGSRRRRSQPGRPLETDAGYARRVRAQVRLTQAEFAARIGVPIETVRNWEQGKRSPRGPARALLKLLGTGARRGVPSVGEEIDVIAMACLM